MSVVDGLRERIAAAGEAKSRRWWQRYLKDAARFHGTSMAKTRALVHQWWRESGLQAAPPSQQKRAALELFESEFTEEKLAGTIALQEIMLDTLTLRDLPRLARLFDDGHIADWNICDWFSVKVLGRLVTRDLPDPTLARSVASWCTARSLWRRRASNVAFVNCAVRGDSNFTGFVDLMLDTCAVTTRDRERFAQTGAGWLLREISVAAPDRVAAFVGEPRHELSAEAVRYATAKLPARLWEPLPKRRKRSDMPARRA